jgi:hypothetical protein
MSARDTPAFAMDSRFLSVFLVLGFPVPGFSRFFLTKFRMPSPKFLDADGYGK